MFLGEKINDDIWLIFGEIYIIEFKGIWFYFMFVFYSLLCNI